MNPRTLLAIVISMIILLAWTPLEKIFFPKSHQSRYQNKESFLSNESVLPQSPSNQVLEEKTITQEPGSFVEAPVVDIPEKLLFLSNHKIIVNFSNKGAAIKGVRSLEFLNDRQEPESILQESSNQSFLGFIEPSSLAQKLFQMKKVSDREVHFIYRQRNGLQWTKIFRLSDSYDLTMQVRIENKGRETLALQDGYVNNVSQSIGPKDAGKNNDRFRVVSLLKEGTSDVKKVKKIKEREVFHDNYQWIALQDKYYALIVKPKSDLSVVYLEKGVFPPHLSFRTKSVVLKPNQVIQDDFIIYVGPKNLKVLKSYDIGFEKIVSFGFFNKISFYLLALLNFFFRLTGNYGIAIILLTCVAKLVLSPLSHKSFKSMKKMQKIQPHIKSMRERHKDNPKKAQVEMMKLYKEHKVNPLGGCLPIVLQMPIFLALFWLLQSAFELRDAPFVFWIHDLSKKDPTYVMPILMGGSMALQQALSPSVVDPAQKKMMMFLPIVMTFLFLNFPAGLVLYWLVNNLLSLAHQKFAHRD